MTIQPAAGYVIKLALIGKMATDSADTVEQDHGGEGRDREAPVMAVPRQLAVQWAMMVLLVKCHGGWLGAAAWAMIN